MKLIVLSDLHLMGPGQQARDPGNHERLARAIDRINTVYDDADLVVVAGDIAYRGASPEPFQDAKAALSRLTMPWTATLGNHDRRDDFLTIFGLDMADDNGFAQSTHVVDGHHVIVLDSLKINTDPEVPYYGARTGELCAQRLGWLKDRLAEAAGAPVIVVLHHNVCPVRIKTDTSRLETPAPLVDLLVAHGNVRQVISGHIHMTTTTLHRGIAFTTLAGGYLTSAEDFGRGTGKVRREGPAQMAVVLSDPDFTTVHFDNYLDAHPVVATG